MKKIRTYATRLVLLIIAVQVLNLSVYGGDFYSGSYAAAQKNIGEFNHIDSLIEYVSEIILDHKNAFPENGDHSRRSSSSHQMKHISIKMIEFKKTADTPLYTASVDMPQLFNEEYKNLIPSEINPPPPKA